MINAIRIARWAALGLLLLLAIGIAVVELGFGGSIGGLQPPTADDTPAGVASVSGDASIGGPFHLVDDKAHPVTDADYRGRWMLVFFGYTNCPDECPLTLQKMATALEKLGSLAGKMAPLFITVDPARDTPFRLASYLANFDPRIIGLTGTAAQIAEAAKVYRVYYSPAEHEKSGADMVGHSTFLYLMNPAGSFDSLVPSDVDADKLAGILRAKLAAKS